MIIENLPNKDGYYWIRYYDKWQPAKFVIYHNKKKFYFFGNHCPIKNGIHEIGKEIAKPEEYKEKE